MGNKYRTIYVMQPGFDFTPLKKFGERIHFITTGLEDVSEIKEVIEESLADFDPAHDAIVPVGKVTSVFILGFILGLREMSVEIGTYIKDDDEKGSYKWQTITF